MASTSPGLNSVHSDGVEDNPYSLNWSILSERTSINQNFPTYDDVKAQLVTCENGLQQTLGKLKELEKKLEEEVLHKTQMQTEKDQALEKLSQLEAKNSNELIKFEQVNKELKETLHCCEMLKIKAFEENRNLQSKVHELNDEIRRLKALDDQKSLIQTKMEAEMNKLHEENLNAHTDADSVSELMSQLKTLRQEKEYLETLTENQKFDISKSQEENDHLKQEFNKWRMEMGQVAGTENDLHTIIVDLKAKLLTRDADIEQLKAQLLISNAQTLNEIDNEAYKFQRENCKKLRIQVQNLKAQLQEFESVNMDLDSKLKKQIKQTDEKEKELDDKKKEISQLKRQISVKTMRTKDIEKKLQAKEDEMKAACNKTSDLEKKLKSVEDAKKKSASLLHDRNDDLMKTRGLLSQISDAEKEARSLYEERTRQLESELKNTRGKIDEKDLKIEQLSRLLSCLTNELTINQDKLAKAESELQHSNLDVQNVQSLKEQLAAEIFRGETLDEELNKCYQNLKLSSAQLSEMRIKNNSEKNHDKLLDEIRNEYAQKIESLNKELENSKGILMEQIKAMNSLKANQFNMQQQLDFRNRENKQLDGQKVELLQEIERLRGRISEYKSISDQLRSSYRSIKEKLQTKNRKLHDNVLEYETEVCEKKLLSDQVSALELKLSLMSEDSNSVSQELEAMRNTSKVMKSEVSMLVNLVEQFQSDLESNKHELDNTHKEVTRLENENSRLNIVINHKETQLSSQMKSFKRLQGHFKIAQSEIKRINQILEERNAELQEQKFKFENHVLVAEKEKDALLSRINHLHLMSRGKEAEMEMLQKRINHCESLIQEKSLAISRLNKEIEVIRKSGETLSKRPTGKNITTSQPKTNRVNFQDNVVPKKSMLNQAILERTVEDLKQSLMSITGELSSMTKRLEESQRELSTTKTQLLETERKYEDLQTELNNVNELHKQQKLSNDKMIQEFAGLQHKLQSVESGVTDNIHQYVQDFNDSYQKQIEALTESLQKVIQEKNSVIRQYDCKMKEFEELKKLLINQAHQHVDNLPLHTAESRTDSATDIVSASRDSDHHQNLFEEWIEHLLQEDSRSNNSSAATTETKELFHDHLRKYMNADEGLLEVDRTINPLSKLSDLQKHDAAVNNDELNISKFVGEVDKNNKEAKIARGMENELESEMAKVENIVRQIDKIVQDDNVAEVTSSGIDKNVSLGSVTSSVFSNMMVVENERRNNVRVENENPQK